MLTDLTAPIHFHCWDTFLHTPRVNTVACLWFFRKAISTLAFSSDGRYLVTGEVSIGLRCVVVFVCLVNAGRCVCCSERSSGGGACVGRERGVAGLWAAGAQVRRVLRGLFPQRQIHRERGIAARHERQPVGLEGMWGVCAYIRLCHLTLSSIYTIMACGALHMFPVVPAEERSDCGE